MDTTLRLVRHPDSRCSGEGGTTPGGVVAREEVGARPGIKAGGKSRRFLRAGAALAATSALACVLALPSSAGAWEELSQPASVSSTSPTITVPADAVWVVRPTPVVEAVSPEELAARELRDRVAALRAAGRVVSDDARWVLPLEAGTYRLTSLFGHRTAPRPGFHNGLDLAAPSGTPLMAVANATVMHVGHGHSALSISGLVVALRLADGTTVAYGHLSSAVVSAGQQVQAGEVVGAVGSTGFSTGPHLHLVVSPNGAPVDPLPWLAGRDISP